MQRPRSPDLEEDLGPHTEEAVDYPECEDHRHAVDEPGRKGENTGEWHEVTAGAQAKEPWQGRDRELNIDRPEVVIDDG